MSSDPAAKEEVKKHEEPPQSGQTGTDDLKTSVNRAGIEGARIAARLAKLRDWNSKSPVHYTDIAVQMGAHDVTCVECGNTIMRIWYPVIGRGGSLSVMGATWRCNGDGTHTAMPPDEKDTGIVLLPAR